MSSQGELPADSAQASGMGFSLSPVPEQTKVRSTYTYQRDIADIEREEMILAIRKTFAENGALDADKAVRSVARLFGFARTGSRIDVAVRNNLAVAVRRRILTNSGGTYALLGHDIGNYTRDELIDALLGAMGRGWTEREDAIRAAARWLGFQRTGRAIQEAFKSAINGAIRRGWLEYEGSQIRKSK